MNSRFHYWFANLRRQSARVPARTRPRRTCLSLERLEDRTVPAVFNVNSLADLSISPGVDPATGKINGTNTGSLSAPPVASKRSVGGRRGL
jgi:hypothetical protein